MSLAPKPCSHCGCANLQYLPNIRVDFEVATTVFGVNATKSLKGVYLDFILVVCTHCGLSSAFMTNADAISKLVPGSSINTVPAR